MSTSPQSPSDRARAISLTLREHGAVLGIDIGGTKLAAGVVSKTGRTLSYLRAPTRTGTSAEELFADVVALARQARDASATPPVAIGIGCGGPIFLEDDTVSPLHMPAWRKFPLRPRLEGAFGLPAALDNDAKAFALGEYLYGAGKGATCMLGMVVSTGIGGGFVVGGKLVDGAHGNAGQVGHTIVSASGPRCFCGAVGCLTAYTAGRALASRAREALKRGVPSTLGAIPPESITARSVAEAATSGDRLSRRLIAESGRALGRGIATAANIFDLDRVVLGGGQLQAGNALLTHFDRELRSRARLPHSKQLEVRLGGLGAESGVVGAASLFLQHWPGVR